MTTWNDVEGVEHMAGLGHFPLLGEPLSLDLVNTRIRRDGIDVDLLQTPAALAAWLRAEADRLTWSGAVDMADLRAVQALRAALAGLLAARREGTRPAAAALRELNMALVAPSVTPRLVWPAAGPQLARPAAASRREALLHALAADAVAVLTGPTAGLLRECAHPDCVLQFVAHNPRRRWCSAAGCGNRARVARHYQRQQADR
ncbi:MAG TPA: ABATE domain-containing protein [Rhodanobacter sp.]|nr:ABATE domain-containing protein [Rhodanobacter sp.]